MLAIIAAILFGVATLPLIIAALASVPHAMAIAVILLALGATCLAAHRAHPITH